MTAGEYVFRHAGGCLIDFPEIKAPPHPVGQPWRWIATLWRDSLRPDGWASLDWLPGERGWQVPDTISCGDVLEFGVGRYDPSTGTWLDSHRWFGVASYSTPLALVVVGPFRNPSDATLAAQPTIDEIRADQLFLHDIEGLTSEWDRAADEA